MKKVFTILFILAILELFLYHRSWYIGFNFITFFIISYLGYWFWLGYPFFKSVLINYLSTPDISRVPLPTIERSFLVVIANNADAIMIAFLALIGIISLLHANREQETFGIVFSLFSPLALVVYFPGITSFLSKIFLTARLQLLVTPFVAFVSASGLLLIVGKQLTEIKQWKPILRIGTYLCVVFFLSLSSIIILANFTDLNLGKLLGNVNRQYFTESELAAFSFADEYGQDILYFGDYASCTYIEKRLGMTVRQTFDVFDPESIKSGYMLFRKQELQSRGRLGFTIWGQDGSGDQEYIYLQGSDLDLQSLWEQEHKIYDSGTLYIYMKKTTE